MKHKVGNINIKTCNEYAYLGTTFTQSNSFKIARKQSQKKASKAIFTFLGHINTREGAKPKTIIKFFNPLVKPILSYNSEVCGAFLKPNKMRDLVHFSKYMFDESHEILQNKLRRCILDVHKKYSSLAVKGELGVYPISINIYINIVKFFYHLGDLSKKGNYYLISNSLYECYKDLYSADSSGNKNWLKAVIYLFKSNGFQLRNLTYYLEHDQQTAFKKLKQYFCKLCEEYFLKQLKIQTG